MVILIMVSHLTGIVKVVVWIVYYIYLYVEEGAPNLMKIFNHGTTTLFVENHPEMCAIIFFFSGMTFKLQAKKANLFSVIAADFLWRIYRAKNKKLFWGEGGSELFSHNRIVS